MPIKQYRVLRIVRIDDIEYQPNQVLSIDATTGERYKKDGSLDDDKKAVEYGRSVGKELQHLAGKKPAQAKEG